MQTPLLDAYQRPHTYLRISVTDRCNLRCRYCMPREDMHFLPHDGILSFEEILRVTRIFARMGVRKVRLTGGEPLVRSGLPVLVEQITRIEGISTVGLTTNGVLLQRDASALRDAGLTALNVSLDSLQRDRYAAITRRDDFTSVLAGITTALEAGFAPVKLNVVIVKGVNDDELPAFVRLTKDRPLNVRFIEYMPFEANGWSREGLLPYGDMRKRIEDEYTLLPTGRGDAHAVAKDFRVPGFRGSVSFISSMSEHFCGGCNRIRLTADGAIKPCLFSRAETGLKDILRSGGSDSDIERAIRLSLASKWHSHPPVDTLRNMANRSMIQIGG